MTDETEAGARPVAEIETAAPAPVAATAIVTDVEKIEHALDQWYNKHFRGPLMAGASDFWLLANNARQDLSNIVKGI